MKISVKGLNLIKKFEGIKFKPYLCQAGVLTCCVGHTGEDIDVNHTYTNEECEALLRQDIRVCELAVASLIKVELSQNEFDSLCSFVFNLGSGALQRSTLRQKLNREDYEGAADEFLKWNKAGGRILSGLTRRRIAERELFLSEECALFSLTSL